jgi:hypothetical protein
MNGDKMIKTDVQHQNRDEESNNTGLGKIQCKQSGTEVGQHTVRNKLNEDLQIMWHTVRLLQMYETKMLPKLRENSKLIKLKEEINGITEELLAEN